MFFLTKAVGVHGRTTETETIIDKQYQVLSEKFIFQSELNNLKV